MLLMQFRIWFEVNSPLLAGLNTYTSRFRPLMTDGKLSKDLIPAKQTPFWHSLRLVPYTHVGHIYTYIYDCAYVVYIQIYLKFFCCPQVTVSVRIQGKCRNIKLSKQGKCEFPTKDFPFHTCHYFNPLNAKLNPICQLLALLGAHHILHVSRIRVTWKAVFVWLLARRLLLAKVECCESYSTSVLM
jgi:hypothetical protein